jgi:Rtf2 RING-finger
MGGDGGVIASSRQYMRHAGTASNNTGTTLDPACALEEQRRRFKTCAVSGQPLDYASIVACSHGLLYNKEAAVEALLQRKQSPASTNIGDHVKRLKDLHAVKFHLIKDAQGSLVPACPVTGEVMTGQLPVILIVPGSRVNVLSEKAIKQMSPDDLAAEYGPIKQRIRLVPDADFVKSLEEKENKRKSEGKEKKEKRLKTSR